MPGKTKKPPLIPSHTLPRYATATIKKSALLRHSSAASHHKYTRSSSWWASIDRWARVCCVLLLVVWCITSAHMFAPMSSRARNLDGPSLSLRFIRARGAKPASESSLSSRPLGLCSRLATLHSSKEVGIEPSAAPSGRLHVGAAQFAPEQEAGLSVVTIRSILVVLITTATSSGSDTVEGWQHEAGDEEPRVSTASASPCALAEAAARSLRKTQTLTDFDVAILALPQGGDGDEDEAMTAAKSDCPDIPDFYAAWTLEAEGGYDAGGAGERLDGADLLATARDFVVFVDAVPTTTSAGRAAIANLQSTTLEKLVLAAEGHSADMVSIQPSSGNGGLVCTVSSQDPKVRHTVCHGVGAPVLLRVPSWLTPLQLNLWSQALVETVLVGGRGAFSSTAAAAAAAAATVPEAIARGGLASLFCAAEEGIRVHSLREQDHLVFFDGIGDGRNHGASFEGMCAVFTQGRKGRVVVEAWTMIADAYLARDRVPLRPGNANDESTGILSGLPEMTTATTTSASKFHRLSAQVRGNEDPHLSNATERDAPGFLLLVPWLEHGGADQFNVNIARALTKLNVRVVIVTTLSSPHPTARDFYAVTPDVFHLPHLITSPKDTETILGVLTHLVVSRNVQVVMVSHSALGYRMLGAFRDAVLRAGRHRNAAPVKFVDFVHLEEMEWGHGGYAAMSLEYARDLDHTFAASQHVASWMRSRWEGDRKRTGLWNRPSTKDHDPSGSGRISVAYIGADTHALRPMPEEDRATARAKLLGVSDPADNNSGPLIAYLARMVDQKLPELYFEIVRQLREERRYEFVSIAIGDGPRLPELRANISRLASLKGSVFTLGMLDHGATIRALAASDILLLPSRNEGISLATYEAMALGVTPVVSAVGGQCELVSDEAGACVPLNLDGDALSLHPARLAAAAMPFVDELEGLLKSREWLDRRRRAARRKVEQQFSMISTMRAIDRGLCGNGRVKIGDY